MVLVPLSKALCKGVRYIHCGYLAGANGERLDNIREEGSQSSAVDASAEKREACRGQSELWDWRLVGLPLCLWAPTLRTESAQLDAGGVGRLRPGNGHGFGGHVEVRSASDGAACSSKVI